MTGTKLPDWRSVLAVVAHPDDESFGLVRAAELAAAAAVLGVSHVELLNHPDGDLSDTPVDELAKPVLEFVDTAGAQASGIRARTYISSCRWTVVGSMRR